MDEKLLVTPLSKHLITSIDKVNETRALTATKVQNLNFQPHSTNIDRPNTHDGKLMPTTPKSKHNRDRIGLSPRQISFKLISDEVVNTQRTKEDRKIYEATKVSEVVDTTTIDTQSLNIINDSDVILTRPYTATLSNKEAIITTNIQTLPSFIKSRSPTKAINNKRKKISDEIPLVLSSAYPSLSHRLNASILYNNNIRNPSSRKNLVSLEENDIHNNHFYITDDASQSTTASTFFQDMSMDDILSYLLDSKQKNSTNAPFVHVASRFNIEYVAKRNFYDLVILDRPGNPKSGLIWTPSHYKADQEKLLPANAIMQLSLYGLLSYSNPPKETTAYKNVQHVLAHVPGGINELQKDNELAGELVSITQFMLEKSQLEYLRTGRFFGCFKECKAFNAWRYYARHNTVLNAKKELLKESYFAEEELVSCMLEISNTIYYIEHNIHLFHYHGNGIICLSDYIEKQIKNNSIVKNKIVQIVNELGNKIEFYYHSYMNSDKLAKRQQDVKDHHPLKDLIKEDSTVKLRSILLIEDEFKRKLKRICLVAQFNIDLAVSKLIKNFWCHFKQFILGIKHVSRNAYYNEDYYWSLDESLFSSDDSINNHSLDYYNSMECILNDKNIHYNILESIVSINCKNDHRTNLTMNDLTESILNSNSKDRNITIKESYRLKNKIGVRINKAWENLGSHICINIHLLKDKTILGINDFLTLRSIENLKVITQPTKSEASSLMFALCSDLSHLIEIIPSIRKHRLILENYIPDFHTVPLYEDPGSSVLDSIATNFANNAYFTTMTMRSIFNTTGGYELAVETLRMVNQAFLEATALDNYVFKLFEIIRSLWSLNPSLLSKRIERSFVLPKLTSYIENPDTVDDLKRSQARDEGQLHAFIAGTEVLHKTARSIQKFHNLKQKLGFVTSFRPIVEQLLIYRSIQNHTLYVKLPNSFNNRCSLFYHFIRKLTEFYDKLSDITNNNPNINDIKDFVIQGLYRLRNFDSIREVFNSEQDSCESIYKMIETSKHEKHNNIELNAIEFKVKSLFSNSLLSNNSAIPSLTSEKLYNVFVDAISSLLTSSNKARTTLMSCINNLKGETIKDRNHLQKLIIQETKDIESYDWSTNEKSTNEVSFYLTKKKSDVHNIQSAVDKNVSAQFILLEAHDIIGAASPILEPSEVDRLVSIDHLNITYHTRFKAWNCVLDMAKIEKQIFLAKVFKSDIAIWSNEFFNIIKTYYNLKQVITDEKLLTNICKYMEKLAPKIEITSYFSTPSLKSRHWKQLSDEIFVLCGLHLKFLGKHDENMYLQDITKKEPLSLGNIKNVTVKEFIDRGIETYLNRIRYITSEAVIESSMEDSLDSVDRCLKELVVHISGEWLRDSTIREKVQIELNEVINITELNVIIKYCIKSVLMVEHSAQDMNTIAFDNRVDKLKVQLFKLDKFITNLDEAQQQWVYLMPFIKFSGRGEIDRDATHMFNKCTEDLKRIEAALQQRSESLIQAIANSTENDLNTENLKSNLSAILDASHSSIQSLLDACPRLSLISYSRLVSLVEVWLFGPHTMIPFVSDCFQDMFEGVGELIVSIDIVTRSFHCLGFHSSDNIETIIFEEPVLFHFTLDEFVKKFNYQLRSLLERSCDQLILNRIKCLQSLLTDSDTSKILDNISNVFQVRVSKLFISFSDKIPNESFYLINSVSFAEDVWTALGHPTGCIVMARSDLAIETAIISNQWRISLNEMLNECKRTILSLQDIVVDMKSFPKINIVKSKALLSSLLLQEISFLRVIEVLIACKCLESATELWAGRYQLRFQYNESERHLQSPIDISLGSISIPYGLEYTGGKIRFLCDLNIENVLQKTIGSALSMRGSLFINHEDSEKFNNKYEASGESSVSMKDIAAGLGRICTTITNLHHPQAVNFYLARILYLDAIGSVDFTNITSTSLQVLIHCMNLFWNAIENKNDQFIQDSLKFPLKTKFARSELQTERRKNNLHALRKNITYMKKTNRFIGIVIVGIASESFYSNISVFDEFYRNIFNAISLVYNKPIDDLGLYLTAVGFRYGMDIQSTLKSSIHDLKDLNQLTLIQSLFTTVTMKELANLSIQTLKLYILSKIKLPTDNAARFKIELLCFCCTLWEKILSYSNEFQQLDLQLLRNEIFLLFYKKLELIATSEEIIIFDQMIGPNELMINKVVANAINKITNKTGLLNSNEFITQCALFWEMISNKNNAVVIIHGEAAIGKTCIRNTVINTIKAIGLKSDCFLSSSWPSKCRRSAELILNTMKIWIKQLKFNRIELKKKQEELEKERLYELSNTNNRDNEEGLVANLDIIQEVKTKINKNNAKKFLKSFKQQDIEKYLVHTSMIHHASLSSNTLLGHFDIKGHWSDGILMRKIRNMEVNVKTKVKNNYIQPFHIIILNGPIGYLVEQIFSSPFYATPSSISLNNLSISRSLLFPNSEYHKLHSHAKIIIETNNIKHASPGCFTFIPMLKVSSSSGDLCIKKLINTWIRSLMHWLGNFSPWLDFLEFLQNLLLNRKFVYDLIYMEHFAYDIQAVEVVSKISSFLRYLEDLLKQIHVLVLRDATFSIPEDQIADNNQDSESESDSESEDDNHKTNQHNNVTNKYIMEESLDSKIGLMSLSLKNRELLLKRGYISIIYAAIWGFGGIYNSTDRKKFFDSAIRDSIMHYFDEDISISTDCSVFECVLDLHNAELVQAIQLDTKNSQLLMNPGIPKKFELNHIYAEISIDNNNLMFHSPSTRAFKIALEHLLSTGANVLVLGSKSCGKTFIINQMLQDLSKNIVSPLKLRQQINENLVDIVNGVRKTEGIFAALDILQYIVNQFTISAPSSSTTASTTSKDDFQIDFTTLWHSAGKQLKSLWRESAKKNFENKNISSSITSVRSASTASDLRYWLEREFTTEVPLVLETSRFSYGLVFIDDLHLSTINDHDNENNMRLIENRIESLLKGIMEGTPLFNIQRNINVRNPNKLGFHDGITMSEYMHETYELPVLHREFCTDPRFPAGKELDDYVLQRTGVLCAATGQYNDFLKSIYFSQMLPHLAGIGLPAMNSTELHVSLIAGAVVSMNSGTLDQTLIEIFKNEIVELSRFTMNMCSQIISSNDLHLTSSLERTIRSLVIIDVSLVSRFCISLQYGCNHIINPGGLLQLYCHEWKRYFLDPLPNGAQRDRIVNLLVEQLDSLDCNQWSITNDWMKALQYDFVAHKDRVWTDSRIFRSNVELNKNNISYSEEKNHLNELKTTQATSPLLKRYNIIFNDEIKDDNDKISRDNNNRSFKTNGVYLPVELDHERTELNAYNGTWNSNTSAFNENQEPEALVGHIDKVLDFKNYIDIDIRTVLYPAAISLMLRMIRILSVSGKHLLLTGYFGSTRITALYLAAKICNLDVMRYDVKQPTGVTESIPSENTRYSMDFTRFMKEVIYKIAGFKINYEMMSVSAAAILSSSNNQQNSIIYDLVPTQRILIGISSCQQLSQADRKLLLSIIDYQDASYIFDNNEVVGMMEALQKDRSLHSNNTSKGFETSDIKNIDGIFNNNQTEQAINPNITSAITVKHQSIFTAYAFHWIKNHLKDSIIRNLTIAIDVDITRSMKLDSNNNYMDATTTIKKMTAATSSSYHHHHHSNKQTSSMPDTNTTNDVKAKNQRYSLLSKRTPTTKIKTNVSDKIFNPNLNIAINNTNNETNNSNNYLELVSIEPNSIFTCPLLGPMISRSFFTLWYDIESYDAARGICSILMKNEKYYLPSLPSMKSMVIKPTPTILSLRTSSIGAYVFKNEISYLSENKDDQKKISKAEEQAKFEEEEKRKKKFKSTEILERFNLVIEHNTIDFKNTVKFLGILDNIGVLKSFSSNIYLDETQEDVINKYISSFIEEARAILPHVLSVPTSADALFLSEPIVIMGSELIAQTASNLVMYLITELSSYLIRRKFILQRVLDSLDNSIEELERMKELEEVLVNSNSSLQVVMRKITKETELLRKQIDGFSNTFECSLEYEMQQMLQEDIYSMKHNALYIENYMKLNIKENRHKISTYSATEWHDFSSHYSGKNINKQYIELMRGVMILIKQTVKVSTKSDKAKASKAEEDNIAKFASTLLIKYNDFINLLLNISANPLSITQLQLLHQVNLNLNSLINLDLEINSAYKVMEIIKEINEIKLQNDTIFENLKSFLLLMELKVILQHTSDNFLNQINIIHPVLIELQQNNNKSKNNKAIDLKLKLDLLLNKMHSIDAVLVKNRKKLKSLEICITKRDILFQGIEKSKIFVEVELSQINQILRCFIGDISISVAILLRVGWLPEQIRQESMEQIRQSLMNNNVITSDNPFLLGQLIDRRQINQWSNFELNSLPRDPASINSMYLLQLVPYFALIIDPDGSAISVLKTNYLENYKTFQVSAQKFSFALFESWIQAYQEHIHINNPSASSSISLGNPSQSSDSLVGISLLITDLQAGVSEDLICFLSSDILNVRSNSEDSSSDYGLEFAINPFNINSSSDSIKKTFKIPCKFRLSMITTKCFSMDEYGSSYPLPISSMKHVTVVHWTEGGNKSYYVDAQPGNCIQNTQYIADQTLSQKMGAMLCKQLSTYHFHNTTSVNQKITLSTLNLYNMEESLVSLMYQCICEEKTSSIVYATEIVVDEAIVNIEFIPMYLLTNEHILQKLIEFIPLRNNHTLDIERSKTVLRDLLAYFQVITEVFSMSIDFIKTCSTFLPQEIVSPYVLTSNAICNNFLKPSLILADQKHFLKGLPKSLKEMKTISKGLSNLQNVFRSHNKQVVHKVSNNNLTKQVNHSSNKLLDIHPDSNILSNQYSPNSTNSPSNQFTATATDRRRSTIRSAKLDWSDQNFGMVHSTRDKVMNEISILLIPLKTFFLRELVHYIQLSIRPGLEWLVKFLLLITTWSQSDAKIPIEEIRTLIYFVMESAGQHLPRYSYLIQNYSSNNQNTSTYNEVSSNEIVKLVASRPSILRPSTNIQNNISKSESKNNYSDFLSELPNLGTMQNRITAYRINQNQENRNTNKIIQPSLEWMDRGYGLIDGLMFNSKSSKWLLQDPNIPNEIHKLTCSARLFRKQCIMLDMQQSIINKNKNIIHKQMIGDSFEYEWFKVKGIRIFSKSNTNSNNDGNNINNNINMTNLSIINDDSNSSNLTGNQFSSKNQGLKFQSSLKMPKVHSIKATMLRKSSTKLTLVSELSKLTVDDNIDENELNKNIITTKNRRLSLINIDNLDDNMVINTHKRSLKAAESNTIARTSKNGRISKQLTNVTSTLGKHRTSLLLSSSEQSSSSSSRNNSNIQPGKISMSHNKSNQNTIIELSQRRITLSQSKRQSTLVSSNNNNNSNNKQQQAAGKTLIGTSGLQNRFNTDGKLIEDISDILTTPLAYKNTLMLETHPQLAKIFKGMSCGIVRNISDFADWKSGLSALKTIDPIKLSEQDLKLLLFTIKPPNFEDYEDEIEQGVDVGLWLKGYELTILQSLLLSEAIVPGSSGSLVEVVFALQASYLQKQGHIVHHSDETILTSEKEIHSDSDDDDDDDDDEIEEEDNFNVDIVLPSRHSSEVKSINNDSNSRSTFFRNLDKFSDHSLIRSQHNINAINSWRLLEKVLKGTSHYRGAQCYQTKNKSLLSCRDYENWESVLLDVLFEDLGIEKYVFTKDLRDSTMGFKSSIFLTNYLNSIQISILSQRARDIAVHHYDHISVMNCKETTTSSNASDDNEMNLRSRCVTDGNIYRNQRIVLVDLIKNIKNAINHQRSKRAIVESLDFQSTFGNSIINSVIIAAMHSTNIYTSTTTNANANPNNIVPISQSQQYFSKLENRKKSILQKLLDNKPNVSIIKSIEPTSAKTWHTSFPLIISSEWGKNVSGLGPLMSLSEMNYVWLPRFTPADVLYSSLSSISTSISINPNKNNTNISNSSNNLNNIYNKHTGIPPSISESCGLLYEELESSLLWVMNCSKCLSKSRITDEIRNRLRGATPVEIRFTACLITLWQLVQYLRCSKRELHDIPAVWSVCLNPISLWQFTRLMLKACDIIELDWSNTTSNNTTSSIKERLQDENFTKAIWILAESFSNNDCNIYSSGNNNNNSHNKINEIKENKNIINNKSNQNNKNSSHAFGLSQNNQSYILQLKHNLNASKITSKSEQNSNNNNNTNRNSTIENGYLSPRAKKQLRRKLRLENEARINYLQALSSSEKFSIYFSKNNCLNTSHISKDNQPEILIEKEFLDQFVSCLGHYISAVIDESKRCKNINQSVLTFDQSNIFNNNKDNSNKRNAFDTFSNISLAAMEARRMSNKINIKNFSNYTKLNDNKIHNNTNNNTNEFEIWPDITDTMDLIFGTMNSNDIIQSMVTWTFHGHIEKNKNIEGKNIKRANILKSIKKLSLLIKEGKVDLYQSNIKY